MSEKRRVAVTGIGVISPVGIGKDAYWRGLLAPQPTDERRVHDFDAADYYEDSKAIRRADLLLVHLADPAALARRLSRAERGAGPPTPAW